MWGGDGAIGECKQEGRESIISVELSEVLSTCSFPASPAGTYGIPVSCEKCLETKGMSFGTDVEALALVGL